VFYADNIIASLKDWVVRKVSRQLERMEDKSGCDRPQKVGREINKNLNEK
jgi:hypothetical protein